MSISSSQDCDFGENIFRGCKGAKILELAKYVNGSVWEGGCESTADYLFFKAPSTNEGSNLVRLAADIEEAAPEFSVASVDSILPIGNQTKASDVVFWHHSPTTEQLLHPLSQQSLCPLPNLWIELFIDVPNDRSRSLEKIREFVNPNCGATCATLAIGIPNAITETMRQRIGKMILQFILLLLQRLWTGDRGRAPSLDIGH